MNKKLCFLIVLGCVLFAISTGIAAEIKIGGVAPLTGHVATFGNSIKNGSMLAFDKVNAAGGVNIGGTKYLIKYIVEDDQGIAEVAANAFRKLLDQDEVIAIIGAVTSVCTLAGAPIAQDAGIPIISPSSTAEQVTLTGDYIFRACFTDPFQGAIMANFSYNDLNARKGAVIFDNANDYTKGLAEVFKKTFEKLGGEIVAYESFTEESKTVDFSAQLTNIKAANPDVLFLAGYYNAVALEAKQARDLGITATFVGADGWDSAELTKLAGKAIDGGFFCNHYSSEDPRPIVQNFVKEYSEKYGQTPDSFGTLGYDSALILIDSLERAGSTDGAAIRDAIKAFNKEVVSGQIIYDENRNPIKSAAIIKVEDGKFVYYKTINP
ncbi:MAG: ABC transporter substrate-binding protein [Candidatus Atribacteria bacterium]|nr:ABC transporter substrate-binding protein [Candidatus Atribacteria bacterium]